MSTADKLTLLLNTKEALRVKLGLGVNVPFSEYANHAYAFSPISLFADGKQGVWYDPSDMTTLFQDTAGTIPVTKDGDPVGLMLDKSGSGNHATQSTSSSRPIYKTNGVSHWIQGDGIDDYLVLPPVNLNKGSILLSMIDKSITADRTAWLSSGTAGIAGYIGSVGDDRALAINNSAAQEVVDTPTRMSLNTKKTFVINKDAGTLRVKSLSQGLLFNSYNSVPATANTEGLMSVTHLFTYNSTSGNRQPINLYQMIGSVNRLTDKQVLNLLRYIEG